MSSDDPSEPEAREPVPDGNPTMQIDALSDVQLSEIPPGEAEDVPDDESPFRDAPAAKPPPLPVRRKSSPPWVLLALVVIAMAALGAAFGSLLLGGDPRAPAPVAEPGAPAPAPPRPQRVEIGEIVIGASAAAEPDPASPSVEASATSP